MDDYRPNIGFYEFKNKSSLAIVFNKVIELFASHEAFDSRERRQCDLITPFSRRNTRFPLVWGICRYKKSCADFREKVEREWPRVINEIQKLLQVSLETSIQLKIAFRILTDKLSAVIDFEKNTLPDISPMRLAFLHYSCAFIHWRGMIAKVNDNIPNAVHHAREAHLLNPNCREISILYTTLASYP